jgi:hypothetical protein
MDAGVWQFMEKLWENHHLGSSRLAQGGRWKFYCWGLVIEGVAHRRGYEIWIFRFVRCWLPRRQTQFGHEAIACQGSGHVVIGMFRSRRVAGSGGLRGVSGRGIEDSINEEGMHVSQREHG